MDGFAFVHLDFVCVLCDYVYGMRLVYVYEFVHVCIHVSECVVGGVYYLSRTLHLLQQVLT